MQRFLGPLPSLTEINNTRPLKPWHGAPLAALRRAFAALGTLRIDTIPPEICSNLQELRHLYTRVPMVSKNVSSASSQTPPTMPLKRPPPDEPPSGEDPSASQMGQPIHRTKRAGRSGQKHSEAHPQHPAGGDNSSNTCVSASQDQWALGPSSSSLEAMLRYGHLFEPDEESEVKSELVEVGT